MKLERDGSAFGHRIDGYDEHGIRIDGRIHAATVLVSPHALQPDFPVQSVEALDHPAVARLLELGPELVLIGTGARQRFPPPPLLAPLYARGIGVEIMRTSSACRVYAVLAAEGRRVVALLFPPAQN